MKKQLETPILETENVANWFFRINGCLTIPNFLVHHERRGQFGTDVDVLAVRFPYRKELALSQNPMVDHPLFNAKSKIDVIICEVKRGLCDLNGPWTDHERENMQRVLYAIGAFQEDTIPDVASALYRQEVYEDEIYRVRLFAVGMRENPTLKRGVTQLTWEQILTFIYRRFYKYRQEKAQHSQWDDTGNTLFTKVGNHRNPASFVEDVLQEMGL